MTPRAVEQKSSNKRTEETFDFPDTSDLCDFGYVLSGPADAPVSSSQTNTQPAK
jgi:hypothetical protein